MLWLPKRLTGSVKGYTGKGAWPRADGSKRHQGGGPWGAGLCARPPRDPTTTLTLPAPGLRSPLSGLGAEDSQQGACWGGASTFPGARPRALTCSWLVYFSCCGRQGGVRAGPAREHPQGSCLSLGPERAGTGPMRHEASFTAPTEGTSQGLKLGVFLTATKLPRRSWGLLRSGRQGWAAVIRGDRQCPLRTHEARAGWAPGHGGRCSGAPEVGDSGLSEPVHAGPARLSSVAVRPRLTPAV